MRELLLLTTLLLPPLAGCAGVARADRLEAALRQREDQIARYERELADLRETVAARPAADTAGDILLAAAETTLSPVADLAFAPLVTGGRDEDGIPGHDTIHALLQPLDADGDLIKARGRLTVELLDVAASEEDRTVAAWSFDAAEMASAWESGLFGSGFRLRLEPQDDRPLPEDALLLAHFETASGTQVDVSKAIKLQPQAASGDRPATPIADQTPSTPAAREVFADELRTDELPPQSEPDAAEDAAEPQPGNPFFEFMPTSRTDDGAAMRTSDLQTETAFVQYR